MSNIYTTSTGTITNITSTSGTVTISNGPPLHVWADSSNMEQYIDENGQIYTDIEDIYKIVAKKYFEKQMEELIDESK